MFERKRNKGFTLIELVMVIVVLAILAVVAIPQFFNLADDATASAEQGIVGGVRAGISTVQAENLVADPGAANDGFPATLDDNVGGDCDAADPCFDNVLGQGGVQSDWSKAGLVYTGPTTTTYTYVPATGAFQ